MNLRFMVICLFCSLFRPPICYSEGSAQQFPEYRGEMKLIFINQMDYELKIFLNTLDTSISIRKNEIYESEILLMDFANTYPLFFGIDGYPGSNYILYSAFKRPVKTTILNFLYYVIIDNRIDSNNDGLSGINILDEKSYLEFINMNPRRYSLGGVGEGWGSFNTTTDDPKNFLEILIINDTANIENVIFTDNERQIRFELDVGKARLIKIKNPIFLQGNRCENIENIFYYIETENLEPYSRVTRVIRMEEGIQIYRLVNTTNGLTTIWTH
jgi:hypothetical protein